MIINTNRRYKVKTKDRTKPFVPREKSLRHKLSFLLNRGYDVQINEKERIINLYELYNPKKPKNNFQWKMWSYTNRPHHK